MKAIKAGQEFNLFEDGECAHIALAETEDWEKALFSENDLYNPKTGEFFWLYSAEGAIAHAFVLPDDPNLVAALDDPDFDMYQDIVGGLNYPGRIIDDPEDIVAELGRIASESGWGLATADAVRAALARDRQSDPRGFAAEAR